MVLPLRVLFYEPNHTGHHFAYLARMLPGFLELGVEAVLATTDAAVASEEYARTLAGFDESLRVERVCTAPPHGAWANARHRLRELGEAVRALEPDHVCVMYADGLWQVLWLEARLGRRPVPAGVSMEGWLYRGDFAAPRRDSVGARLRRWAFADLLRRNVFTKLHIDHELLHAKAQGWTVPGGTEVVLTPNPVALLEPMGRAEARRRLGLQEDGRLVASMGMMSGWKGIDLLLAGFERFLSTGAASKDDRLLLAGPHDDPIKRMLQRPPFCELVAAGRVVSLDRFLDESEMFACAAASDVTAAVYPHHSGRSSIILWAAAAGRPSMGTAWGCIGHVIREQQLGLTCESLQPEALAAQIGEALAMPWTPSDAERVRRYATSHRVENYQRVASALVRQRLKSDGAVVPSGGPA